MTQPQSFLPQSILGQPMEPLQIISLICVAILLIQLWIDIRREPKKWLWNVPLLGLVFHMLMYYSILFADRYTLVPLTVSYTNWSSILRLHEIVTLLSLQTARIILKQGVPVSVKVTDYIEHHRSN